VSKNRKLGRGLDALLGDDFSSEDSKEIRVDEIRANPWQPRQQFDKEALEELAQSIRTHGVVQPIIVRRAEDGYELIAGERRLRAAELAGLHEIPALVREYTDREAAEIALIENLQRENLTDIEEGQAYSRLMDEYNFTQKDMAETVGKSRSYIANMVRLLSLPEEVQQMIRDHAVTGGQVRPLLTLKSEAEQIRMARVIRDRGLSARQVEDIIRRRKERKGKKDKNTKDQGESWIHELEEKLHTSLGTPVSISFGRGKFASRGKIMVSFKNEEEFERLMKRLTEE
jgi:ParB family chromosome partitioning protein